MPQKKNFRRKGLNILLRLTERGMVKLFHYYKPNGQLIRTQKEHFVLGTGPESGFGGLEVSVGTRVRGFKPGRSRRIFRAKKSSARLPSEGK